MKATAPVLIVEDDRDVRDSLIEVLEDEGVCVAPASNGAEAIGNLKEALILPRLILLDLMMPVMDGRPFRVAQLKEPRWAVVMTATGDFKEESKRLNVSVAIRKPLDLAQLFAVVGRYRA